MAHRRLSGWAWVALGLVTVAAVALLLVVAGTAEVAQTLRTASLPHVAFAIASYAAFFVLRGIRWRLLLRGIAPRAGLGSTTGLTAMGWLVSTYVPFKAGDVARAAVLARRERTSFLAVGGTVALERVLDVAGIALAATLGLALAVGLAARGAADGMVPAIAATWLLAAAALVGLAAMARLRSPAWNGRPVLRFAGRFLDALEELRRQPRLLLPLASLTVLIVATQVAVFAALVLAVEPGAPVLAVLAAVPLLLLSFGVAVLPGHVGTFEVAFVAVFALVGLDPAALLAEAVAVHALSAAIATGLGAIGLAALVAGPAPLRVGPPGERTEPGVEA